MNLLGKFFGFGQMKTPEVVSGAVSTEEGMEVMLVDTSQKIKIESGAEPLFSASGAERRRAEAIYDAWMKRAMRNGKFAEGVTITPALAEVLLKHNPDNRKISRIAVNKYASDMSGGRWEFNGEAIVISDTGELNDGQTRLTACVQSGVSFQTIVVVGVSRQSRETLDQGARRTPGQQLQMLGYKDSSNLGHAGRVYWQLATHGRVSSAPEFACTWPQILETVEENPGLCDTAYGHRAWKAKLGGVGLHVALRLWCANIGGVTAAEKFFEPVVSSLGFRGKTDPAYQLHKRLEEGKKLNEVERAAFVIKAWNAFRRGQPIRVLKFLPGEDFPQAE